MTYLLDTMVASQRAKARPEPQVIGWLGAQSADALYLSVLTLGELRYGAERLPAGRKRRLLTAYASELEEAFEGRVLPFDTEAAASWAAVRRTAELRKRTLPTVDAMLAATAELHGLTLVTRNVRDFEGWGGPVLNLWEPQPPSGA